MDNKVGLRPTYDVGYKGVSKTGESFEVISYEGRKKIGIRFECGYERNTTSTHIKNKTTPYKRVFKTCLGDTLTHRDGMTCTVVDFKSDSEITVEFENGAVRKTSYARVLSGKVGTGLQEKVISVGDRFETNSYGYVTVVEYRSAKDIQVVFEDGSETTTYANSLRIGTVGHPTFGVPLGFKFTNSDGCVGDVVEIFSESNITVEWEDGVRTYNVRLGNARRGAVYYPNAKTLAGVGYFGIGKYKPNRSGKNINYCPVVYRKWHQMITRCYNPYEINKDSCKAYKDVHVCEEWHCFQNFAEWAENHSDKFVDGYELDKDMFGTGYLYCPKYCTLLPAKVNGFLSNSYSNKLSGLPEGVNVIRPNPKYPNAKVGYCARCHVNGERKYLGYYDCPFEAGKVYSLEKEKEARRLAEEYKDCMTTVEYEKLKSFTLEDIHRK